jgi:hypothetical protein
LAGPRAAAERYVMHIPSEPLPGDRAIKDMTGLAIRPATHDRATGGDRGDWRRLVTGDGDWW